MTECVEKHVSYTFICIECRVFGMRVACAISIQSVQWAISLIWHFEHTQKSSFAYPKSIAQWIMIVYFWCACAFVWFELWQNDLLQQNDNRLLLNRTNLMKKNQINDPAQAGICHIQFYSNLIRKKNSIKSTTVCK